MYFHIYQCHDLKDSCGLLAYHFMYSVQAVSVIGLNRLYSIVSGKISVFP